jgi:hemoglobin
MNDIRQTPYDLLGGEPQVRRLVERFYDLMESAPQVQALRAMHAADLTPMRAKLGDFLCGWLGGPALYNQRPDAKCMSSAHAPYAIDTAVRDQWMWCMNQALADIDASESVCAMVAPAFARVCEALRNR